MPLPRRTIALTAGALVLALAWLALFRFALGTDRLLLLATLIAILLWTVIRVAGRVTAAVGGRRRTRRLAELAKQCCADDVRFALRRPPFLVPEVWTPLLVQVYRSEDGREESVRQGAVAQLEEQAERLLGADSAAYVTATEDSIAPVPRDAPLRFIPDVPGCRFNPPVAMAEWSEATLSVSFRMKASRELEGDTARGRLSIFAGPLLLAEMAIVLRVTSQPHDTTPAVAEPVAVAPYRRVFASYSHRDEPVVRQMELFARAFGDDFMRDVTRLRAGEEWSPRIAQMIEEADVFQLFWSSNSMNSTYVASEWRHALSLRRSNFIRPIYWEQPLPASPDRDLPPAELKRIHFQRLPLEDMGVRRRSFPAAGSTAAVAVLAGVLLTMQLGGPEEGTPADAPPDVSEAPYIIPVPPPPPPPPPPPGPDPGSGGVLTPGPPGMGGTLPGPDVLQIGAFVVTTSDTTLERVADRIVTALRARQAAPATAPDTTVGAVPRALLLAGTITRADSVVVVELHMLDRRTNDILWSSRVDGLAPGEALEQAVVETVVARTGGRVH